MSFRSRRLIHKMKIEQYKANISHLFLMPNQNRDWLTNKSAESVDVQEIDNGRIVTFNVVDDPGSQLVYFHGGAFTVPLNDDQLAFAINIAKKTNSQLKIIDFPLLLAHKASEMIDFCIKAFDECMLTDLPINMLGDSAGAYLMLQVASRRSVWIDKTIIISPWIDLTLTNLAVQKRDDADVFLELDVLQTIGQQFIDGLDKGDTVDLFDPNNLTGLNVILFYGANEMLVPDNERFVATLRQAAKTSVTVVEFSEAFHEYILWHALRETKQTNKQVTKFIANK
ncbi:alpha/beta hydrolase fold domain-containing protein [Lentilactobacillus sp. SPB1-3]|uniref:Alpha/beta hydrolase fold domain-containing protein n=1 Tax=Lentilactobacillus terminaliae TaxID=3003483 RepID=A0ACD5DEL8_9LACO|nr:alpha/beta hydrolase [Lentilactobacillus sp. SPB1-3]MCZ0977496.1 alpha/beta hydrolase [Lentilactobacillus sp. SPB1-3]